MIEKLRGKERQVYIISLFILLSFFIQLLDFPNKLMVVFGVLICIYYWIIQKRNMIGLREVLLFTSMLFYVWFSGRRTLTGISIVILPVTMQIVGRYILNYSDDKTEIQKRLFSLLVFFVLGYTIHAVLNIKEYMDLNVDYVVRDWEDFWTGNIVPATQHSIYFLPILALIFTALLYIKKKTLLCGGVLITGVFFIWFSFLSQSRMQLVILCIVFIWGMFLWFMISPHKQISMKTGIMYGVLTLIVIAVLGLVLWQKWEDIRVSGFYAMLNRDGGIFNNVRFQAQRSAVKQLFAYPFGGYQMDLGTLGFTHNVWLDTANAAGIIPFITLVAYTLLGGYDLFVLLRNKQVSSDLKYIISSLWLAMILYYMVETALEATVQFIVPWTYLNGLIFEYNRSAISKGILFKGGQGENSRISN